MAPPLLGAIIGFLTNALAIRMLFRPLREVRIFGLHVPLTPGVIPRRRQELARSIGRMVSEQLLSADAITARLQSPDIESALADQVAAVRRSLMERRLGELLPGFGEEPIAAADGSDEGTGQGVGDAREPDADPGGRVGDLLRPVLRGLLARLIGSRGFMNGVRVAVDRAIGAIGKMRLTDVANADRVTRLVADRLLPLLSGSEVRDHVALALRGWSLGKEGPLTTWRELLSGPGVPDALGDALQAMLPALTARAFSWLRQPEIHAELAARGRTVVRDVLDKLSLVQKVFVTAGQYDRTLADRMPEIIDDVLDQAEEAAAAPEVRDRIVAAALAAVSGSPDLASGTGVPSGDSGDGGDGDVAVNDIERIQRDEPTPVDDSALPTAVVAVVTHALELVAQTPEDKVRGWVERLWAREGGQTLTQLASRYLQVSERDVTDTVANRLLAALARPEVQAQLAEIVPEMMSGHESSPTLGELITVDDDVAERLDRWIGRRLATYLSRRIPELVETLDVEQLVVARIDSLAVEDVERLLLTVIARHLKWINAFGAVIGALIGVVQLMLRFLPSGG